MVPRFGATTGRTLDQDSGVKLLLIESVVPMSIQIQVYEVEAAALIASAQGQATSIQ